MNELKCLSEQELSEFVQGRIDAVRVEQIAEHLEACDDCQSTIVMLGERSDTFIHQLRSPAIPDALEAEDACEAAVQRLARHAADWHSEPAVTTSKLSDIQQVGPYQIQGELGAGGMGTVFKAVHSKLKRLVALKILPTNRSTNLGAIARFEREMEVIGQLDHPNIVRASDAGEENGMHYLVMEHVDGLDLSRIVRRTGPLSVADACEIARQAAIGLQYANDNHLVHRDIKPSNLMLAASAQRSSARSPSEPPKATVKILDLGLALLDEAHVAHEHELTTVGQLMGTLDYMSPEQGMDSHEVDIRADIYSLGATLYKLLSGCAPFASPQYNTLLKKVTALANKPVTPIAASRSDIPNELAAIIDRMLAKDPEQRFSSPRELATALEPFAQGADLSKLLATAANLPEPASKPPVCAIHPLAIAPAGGPQVPASFGRSKWWRYAGVLLAIPLLLAAAGTIIYINSDRGVLIVEADQSAQLSVRQGNVTVRQLEVARGENAVTVRSGAYQIELKGKSDELTISQNKVVIKRGERVLVRVEQRPAKTINSTGDQRIGDMPGSQDDEMMGSGYGSEMSSAGGMLMEHMLDGELTASEAAPSKPAPTYDGRTYTQWLAELETERKPERLTEAIRAFASLGEDDTILAAQSAAVIMHIMRRNGSDVIDASPQGTLIKQAQTVLLQLPGEILADAIEVELRNGNTRSRTFANMLLGNAVYGYGSPRADFVSAIARRRESLYPLLLAIPADESPIVRAKATSLAIHLAESTGSQLANVDGLIPWLQAALTERDFELVALGSKWLTKLDPDHQQLMPALMRLLKSEDVSYQVQAARLLGRLGTRSQVAVSSLIDIIKPIAASTAKPQGAGGMYGMDGGGLSPGMGGGMSGYGGGMGFGGYDPNQNIYYVAIEALGLIGPAAKEALPVLRQFAHKRSKTNSLPGSEGYTDDDGGDGSGASSEADSQLPYAAVARQAINRIEGKEPIPTASELDAAAASAMQSGGFF